MTAVHDPLSDSPKTAIVAQVCEENNEGDTQTEHTLELAAPADSAPPPLPLATPPKNVTYDVIKQMRKFPDLISMFDVLCMSPASRMALEFSLAEIAEKNGGSESFFMNNNGVKDYITDVEFMGHPLPILTKVNQEQ